MTAAFCLRHNRIKRAAHRLNDPRTGLLFNYITKLDIVKKLTTECENSCA